MKIAVLKEQAADDGIIFVTNMGQSFNAQKGVTGDLLQWSAKTGWQAVPGSQRPGWNGIVVAKDGSRLYAAAWPDREVVEFILGRSGQIGRASCRERVCTLVWI